MNRDEEHFKVLRYRMVAEQLRARGIRDQRVLQAMEAVPRHRFVADQDQFRAYEDGPLPIGYGQTISQPYIVAFMTECLELEPTHSVLEIGTGCGYQTAILAFVCDRIVSVERITSLADKTRERLLKMGYRNIKVVHGDGFEGYGNDAPYDRIMVTAAPKSVPQKLIDQLNPGGIMVIPVGKSLLTQHLEIIAKDDEGKLRTVRSLSVRFVPMV